MPAFWPILRHSEIASVLENDSSGGPTAQKSWPLYPKLNVWSSGGSAKRESDDATDKVGEEGEPKQICGKKEEGEEDFIVHMLSMHMQTMAMNNFSFKFFLLVLISD